MPRPEDPIEQTLLQLAQHDEQVAIKILGGLGTRNHMGDNRYAAEVADVLLEVAQMQPEEVECIIVLAKVRQTAEEQKNDKFAVKGAVVGTELELTALHAVIASRIRQYRAIIQEGVDNGKVENKGH